MTKYIYWEYGYDNKTGDFILIPDVNINKPKTFFKYYALTKNSVDALTNLYVYASHPEQLNDPFDCDKDLAIIKDMDVAKAIWGELFDRARAIFDMENDILQYTTDCFSTLMFTKYGILSLTDSCENTIMWSCYAQNKGFCLEFDVEQFPFKYKGPFPIHYVDKIDQASTENYNVQELLLIQSNVKKDCWKYENEWRLMLIPPDDYDLITFGKDANRINKVLNLHDRKFTYPIKALKSITLGVNFFKELHERQQIVSTSYYELHLFYTKACLETKILDFLDTIKNYSSVQVRLIVKQRLTCSIIPIIVTKLNDLTYRISEV